MRVQKSKIDIGAGSPKKKNYIGAGPKIEKFISMRVKKMKVKDFF